MVDQDRGERLRETAQINAASHPWARASRIIAETPNPPQKKHVYLHHLSSESIAVGNTTGSIGWILILDSSHVLEKVPSSNLAGK